MEIYIGDSLILEENKNIHDEILKVDVDLNINFKQCKFWSQQFNLYGMNIRWS